MMLAKRIVAMASPYNPFPEKLQQQADIIHITRSWEFLSSHELRSYKPMDNTHLSNHFLIAMPTLDDGNFSRSVTYMCEHDTHGSLGITINRPSDIQLGEIFQQLNIPCDDPAICQQMVYMGGPVQQDRGFLLHAPCGNWEASLRSLMIFA